MNDNELSASAMVAEFHARVLDYENSNERLRDEVTRLRLQINDLIQKLEAVAAENDRLRHVIVEGGSM